MEQYEVKIPPRVAEEIDEVYCHIADDFKDIGAAEKHAMLLEEAMPLLQKDNGASIGKAPTLRQGFLLYSRSLMTVYYSLSIRDRYCPRRLR